VELNLALALFWSMEMSGWDKDFPRIASLHIRLQKRDSLSSHSTKSDLVKAMIRMGEDPQQLPQRTTK
jgi:hypothetical protein